jgi:hypothetical protein
MGKLNPRLFVTTLLVLLALCARSSSATAPAAPPYKITAVKAMLFYNERGTFSRDILASPPFALWNTVIGEGDAGAASTSTLVLVEVTGRSNPNEAPPARKVEFTATAAGKVLVRRTSDISLGDGGKFYAPFWLYDTGCQTIKVTARVLGQTQASTMSKTLPFECGE